MDEIIDSVFKRRLMLNYYKVEKVFSLSVEDKIPELSLLEENDINRVKIEKYVDDQILNEMFNVGQMMFKISHRIIENNIELPKNHGLNEIEKIHYPIHNNISKENIIYYDSDWYDLQDLLLKKKEVYPENDEYFTDIFILRISEIYKENLENQYGTIEKHEEKYQNIYKLIHQIKDFGIELGYDAVFFNRPGIESGVDDGNDEISSDDDDDDYNVKEKNDGSEENENETDIITGIISGDDVSGLFDDDDDDGGSRNELSGISDSDSDNEFISNYKKTQPNIYEENTQLNIQESTQPNIYENQNTEIVDISKFDLSPPVFLPPSQPQIVGDNGDKVVSKTSSKKKKEIPVYDYDEIDGFTSDTNEKEKEEEEELIDEGNKIELVNGINKVTEKINTTCDNCGKVLKNNGISSYQHSSKDLKDVKIVTMCIECLHKNEINDFE